MEREINYNNEKQKMLADIEISRANLYVFKDSCEKEQWSQLLDKAEQKIENIDYAQKLIDRVNNVIDSAWRRIFRWQNFQKKITKIFIFAIAGELIIISIYYYFVDVLTYGFLSSIIFGLLGGTLSVALNIGKDLKVEKSNRLQMLRLILRPFIGAIGALVLYLLLQLNMITILPQLNEESVLIILSIFAGYSEKFITRTMNNYIPQILENKNK
ncbi:hypothetical protein KKC65_02870 [Patescibacteria group bacterium]|nr:hypothetical protein [Patescibacteria group bacterium]